MAWDSRRPVPWRRLLIEWAVLSVIAGAVFAAVSKEHRILNGVSVVIGGGIYVLVAAVLAKFGYQRKTLRQLRAEAEQTRVARQAAQSRARTGSTSAPRASARPAPTRRTNAGSRRTRPRK